MTNACNIGMLVNHGEIEHLLTSMSDSLRNAAYKVANEIAPKGSEKYNEYFDEVGTLRGYDEDTNKALLRDCLDHYVQYANAFGGTERTDFSFYLDSNFQMVSGYISQRPEVMAYLTGLFARACGILSSVLQPVMEDIYSRGQLINKIESFVTGPENTYYLVYGDDIDNPETYDPKEDDLSDVDCSQTEAELKAIEERNRLNSQVGDSVTYIGNGEWERDKSAQLRTNPITGATELRTQDGTITEVETPPPLNYDEYLYASVQTQPQQSKSINLMWNPDT